MTAASAERRRLVDTLRDVGPDAPTLCHPWSVRDLAAHLIVRERRPDAAIGILVGPLARYTDKVQRRVAADPWDTLVARLDGGPPAWSPARVAAVDRAMNTAEYFVHHEDILRVQPGWSPRQLDPALVDDLADVLKRAKLLVRKAPCGIVLAPDDGHPSVTAKQGEPTVTVRGAVGELVLWAYGRQAHAVVGYDGPADAVTLLQTATFGI